MFNKREREVLPTTRAARVELPDARREPLNVRAGLTAQQVRARTDAGQVNVQEENLTPSVGKIVLKNCISLFNIINLILVIALVLVKEYQNTLFFGVVICNTAMGIIQELRAKKTLDKLTLLAQTQVTVVRDGRTMSIAQDEIVLGDIVYLSSGDQICADAVVVETNALETDESLLTGESDKIRKKPGDTVLSGSYVAGGHAYVQVTAVGEDNYANALTKEVKQSKKQKSKLLHMLNLIIRILTFVIIPLGALLFYSNYYVRAESIETSVVGTVAAMAGMIPGGLVLLTGVTLTVGALNLARRKALVQSLESIETLARVDVLCLDKTGTITDGNLVFERLELQDGAGQARTEQAIAELMYALQDDNPTAKVLRETFGESGRWPAVVQVPFSSDRKWSGVTFSGNGSYILGAPNIIFSGAPGAFLRQANEYAAEGYRVLCLAHCDAPIRDERLPQNLRCETLLLLSDSIREDAADTFRYFADEGVTLKVISGDNPRTVSAVAQKAGLQDAYLAIDMSGVGDSLDYTAIVDEYTVFGHVTPQQKRELIRAMQKNGHTTCMTGDGVNDILAMRESDCSVAMVGGSSAARSACDFVLMSENFGAMINVLKEGRRVINNIERVSVLYLVNTIYSVLLALLYSFLPLTYPYESIQMTPINALTVGIPSFFLALQANYARPSGRMLSNIFEYSFPAALTIVFNTLYLQLAGVLFGLPKAEVSTMVVFLIGIVGFFLLLRISRPYTVSVKVLLGVLVTGFVLLFTMFEYIFSLESLFSRVAYFYLPLMYFSFHIHGFLAGLCRKILLDLRRRRQKKGRRELA